MARCEIMYSVVVVAGNRPEAIKLSSVLKWLRGLKVDAFFSWSGQHYYHKLSTVFFKELGLPSPMKIFDVKSGTSTEQTAQIMGSLEKVIVGYKPSLVTAEGETNTVLATTLASIKTHTAFHHIEAVSLRSNDRTRSEE